MDHAGAKTIILRKRFFSFLDGNLDNEDYAFGRIMDPLSSSAVFFVFPKCRFWQDNEDNRIMDSADAKTIILCAEKT